MTGPLAGAAAAMIKAMCAASYSADTTRLLLGESFHPGGLALTRHLAHALGLQPGQRVVDVASGRGASARLLAVEFGATVDAVDLAQAAVAHARGAVRHADLAGQLRLHVGDAERLPFASGDFDVVLCECALSTFPNKPAATAEFARVLRPGGRVGITDVTLRAPRLPGELATLEGWVACLAGAQSLGDYGELLTNAGLRVKHVESHDGALVTMIDQVRARLNVLGGTARDRRTGARLDLDRARRFAELASRASRAGQIGYSLLVAVKPE